MMPRFLLWTVLSLFFSNPIQSKFHDYYFSVAEIEFNQTEMRFEIIINMFSDNLSLALDKKFSIKSEIGTSEQILEAEDYVFRYILENFAMQVQGSKLDLEFVGMEADLNQATIFLQTLPLEHRPKKVNFFNQLLVREYPDQSNIIHLLSNGLGMTGTTNESKRFTEIELIKN